MNKLTFSPCPTTKHKGELWKKLWDIDTDIERFILQDISFSWSDFVPIEWIQDDTFPDYSLEDWRELMQIFYKMENVFGIMLTFEDIYHEYELTTFRAYKPQTHLWYESKLKKEDDLWRINIKQPKESEPEPETQQIKSLEEF